MYKKNLRLKKSDVIAGAILLIAGVAVTRFAVAAAMAFALASLTLLTPWPLRGVARNVFLILLSCPVAVTLVAVANMFHLKPRQASALFVVNTLLYLLLVLPIVLWVFG